MHLPSGRQREVVEQISKLMNHVLLEKVGATCEISVREKQSARKIVLQFSMVLRGQQKVSSFAKHDSCTVGTAAVNSNV